jgi:hypothetical protein
MGWACITHEEKRNAYRILVGNPEGNRTLGRLRCKWEDNITMDLRNIGWGGMDWIDVTEDKDHWRSVVKTVLKLQVL